MGKEEWSQCFGMAKLKSWPQSSRNVVEGPEAKAPYEETLEHPRVKAVLENGLKRLQIDVQDWKTVPGNI